MAKRTSVKPFRRVLIALLIICLLIAAGAGALHLLRVASDQQEGRALAERYTGLEDAIAGLDVSSYQEDISFEGLKEDGFQFVYIKATEGSSHVDPKFQEHWKGAHRAHLLRGAYHFLSFDTDGRTQAENFIETVPGAWLTEGSRLPPAVDIEMYGDYETVPPSKEEIDAVLQPLLEALEERYDKKPVLYTNPYIYETYLRETYADYPVWISAPDLEGSDGIDWTFCQFSFEGSSEHVDDGVKDLDLNVFDGSLRELKKLDR